MPSINKLNRIHSDRQYNMYVDRKISIENVDLVSPVDPIGKMYNDSGNSNENYLFSSDQFYESLSSLKDEYKRFYHDEQNLEKFLQELDESDVIIFAVVEEFIEIYNSAASSLKILDESLNLKYFKGIYNILSSYETNLKRIGITLTAGFRLQIDENEFRYSLIQTEDKELDLFKPMRSFFKRLYRFFKNVNIQKHPLNTSGYTIGIVGDYSGLLMDKKM